MQVSNKYVVPPCVRRRSCRPPRLQQREEAATLASVHKLQFVGVFVSEPYVSLRESTVTPRNARCCTWQTKQAADPLDVRSMGAEMFCSDESRSSDGRRATRGSETLLKFKRLNGETSELRMQRMGIVFSPPLLNFVCALAHPGRASWLLAPQG